MSDGAGRSTTWRGRSPSDWADCRSRPAAPTGARGDGGREAAGVDQDGGDGGGPQWQRRRRRRRWLSLSPTAVARLSPRPSSRFPFCHRALPCTLKGVRGGQGGGPPPPAAATDTAGGWRGAAGAVESAGGVQRADLAASPPCPLRPRRASGASDAPAAAAPCGRARAGLQSRGRGEGVGGGTVEARGEGVGQYRIWMYSPPLIWVGLLMYGSCRPTVGLAHWPWPETTGADQRPAPPLSTRPASTPTPPATEVGTQVASTFFAHLSGWGGDTAWRAGGAEAFGATA